VKPPPYPLQAVLDLRGASRAEAQLRLAEAIRALGACEAELAAAESKRAGLAAECADHARRLYEPGEAGHLEVALIERRHDALQNLEGQERDAGRAVGAAREATLRAEEQVAEARERLVEADRELQATEKHHQAWLDEWRREQTRREQRQSEEVTLARYAAGRASDEDAEPGGHA
jgi:flagellar biosynthesis chaperone FliJ